MNTETSGVALSVSVAAPTRLLMCTANDVLQRPFTEAYAIKWDSETSLWQTEHEAGAVRNDAKFVCRHGKSHRFPNDYRIAFVETTAEMQSARPRNADLVFLCQALERGEQAGKILALFVIFQRKPVMGRCRVVKFGGRLDMYDAFWAACNEVIQESVETVARLFKRTHREHAALRMKFEGTIGGKEIELAAADFHAVLAGQQGGDFYGGGRPVERSDGRLRKKLSVGRDVEGAAAAEFIEMTDVGEMRAK